MEDRVKTDHLAIARCQASTVARDTVIGKGGPVQARHCFAVTRADLVGLPPLIEHSVLR